ncbi:DGQHR domain-containing protein [Brevibacterium sediminis]|uniref:DGQHR domain-containing protein n=1 Tax=Brevibacterium sediminis TaxID=1857024 RepID=UPI002174EF4E|nr:DGQHR domain-containing protein [Brevibacterium sediminis]MCS4594806.1 DGQHR domain-containing protein [Brevibacterium sediminis]
MIDTNKLLTGREIRNELKNRANPNYRMKVHQSSIDHYQTEGWVVEKELTKDAWLQLPKPHDVAFEDRVWEMCAKLGFKVLNADRDLRLKYAKGDNETKQLDVLAIDDDVILVFECKSSQRDPAPTNAFKQEIEAIKGFRTGIIGNLRKHYPNRKVKFVLATNNINVTDETISRMNSANVSYMDEESVDYYLELAAHLGEAAKYQLLGNIFKGEKIEAINSKVPAIRGKMGGRTYYSFSIEPARLLKIAYVLHRNNANKSWMPTYQRVIKRNRLKKVSDFVDSGGVFPNSLIINIDNGGKSLRFEPSHKDKDDTSSSSKLGILHLPQKYRAAYVIDGQHRLYGFANSERAETELIPVTAFVDLPGEDQLDLFMQINENQQAVPKNLRLTLKADLEWTSSDKKSQAQALKLRVAQMLGDNKTSVLRGRIILGEEKSDEVLCITLDAVNRGIASGRYIGEFTKTEMRKVGSFYRGSNQATVRPLVEFFELCFEFLRDQLPDQWRAGKGEGGLLFTNAGTEAVLRLIGDIVDHLVSKSTIDPRVDPAKDVFIQVRPMLGYVADYLGELSNEEIVQFRSWFGSGAPTKYLRQFQSAIVAKDSEFSPEGYDEWKLSQEKMYDQESLIMVRDIEEYLKYDVRSRLESHFGENWFKLGVPRKVYQSASTLAADKQYDAADGIEIDWWDCIFLINYRDIFVHGSKANWDAVFNDRYTFPLEQTHSSWKDRSKWVIDLNEIRKKTHHAGGTPVTEDEYEFLLELHNHFDLGGTGGNN